MPNAISFIFAVLLSTVAMFYVPTYHIAEKEENLAYLNTYETVVNFVDNVRTKGYITPKMYEDFQQQLHIGNVLYDVKMVHKHKVYTPVVTNAGHFTGEYIVDYDEFYWEQISEYLYGDKKAANEDERMYRLEVGDFFQVYVENKTKLKSTMIFDFLTFNIGDANSVVISIPYGGMVLNEDY